MATIFGMEQGWLTVAGVLIGGGGAVYGLSGIADMLKRYKVRRFERYEKRFRAEMLNIVLMREAQAQNKSEAWAFNGAVELSINRMNWEHNSFRRLLKLKQTDIRADKYTIGPKLVDESFKEIHAALDHFVRTAHPKDLTGRALGLIILGIALGIAGSIPLG